MELDTTTAYAGHVTTGTWAMRTRNPNDVSKHQHALTKDIADSLAELLQVARRKATSDQFDDPDIANSNPTTESLVAMLAKPGADNNLIEQQLCNLTAAALSLGKRDHLISYENLSRNGFINLMSTINLRAIQISTLNRYRELGLPLYSRDEPTRHRFRYRYSANRYAANYSRAFAKEAHEVNCGFASKPVNTAQLLVYEDCNTTFASQEQLITHKREVWLSSVGASKISQGRA